VGRNEEYRHGVRLLLAVATSWLQMEGSLVLEGLDAALLQLLLLMQAQAAMLQVLLLLLALRQTMPAEQQQQQRPLLVMVLPLELVKGSGYGVLQIATGQACCQLLPQLLFYLQLLMLTLYSICVVVVLLLLLLLLMVTQLVMAEDSQPLRSV